MTVILEKSNDRSIDTSKTVRYYLSKIYFFSIFIVIIIICVTLSYLAIGTIVNGNGGFSDFLGLMFCAFFGLLGLLCLWMGLTIKGPVLILSPEGILDQRLSPVVIDWKAIDAVEEWTRMTRWPAPIARGLLLKVKPESEAKLALTFNTKLLRWPKPLADGLATTAAGTEIDHARLMKLARAYWKAHAAVSGDRSQKRDDPNLPT